MKRLKKIALGKFTEAELRQIEDVANYLSNKRNFFASIANRSSNFDEVFNMIYEDGIITKLVDGITIERQDNKDR